MVTSGSPLPLSIRAPPSSDGDDNANDDGVSHSSDDDSASFLSGDDEFGPVQQRRFFVEPVPESLALPMEPGVARLVGEEDDDGLAVPVVSGGAGSSFPGGYVASPTMAPIARVSEEDEDEDGEGEGGEGVLGDGEDEFGSVGIAAGEPVPKGSVEDRMHAVETENLSSKAEFPGDVSVGVLSGADDSYLGSDLVGETIGSAAIAVVEVVESAQQQEIVASAEPGGSRPEGTGVVEVEMEQMKPESAANEVVGNPEQGEIGGAGLGKHLQNPELRVAGEAVAYEVEMLHYWAIESDNGAEEGTERSISQAPDSKKTGVLDVHPASEAPNSKEVAVFSVEKTSASESGFGEKPELESTSVVESTESKEISAVQIDKSGVLSGDAEEKIKLEADPSVNGEESKRLDFAAVGEDKAYSLEAPEKLNSVGSESYKSPQIGSETDAEPFESSKNSVVDIQESGKSNVDSTSCGDVGEEQNGGTSVAAASDTSVDLGTESVRVFKAPEQVAIGSASSNVEPEDEEFVECKASFVVAGEDDASANLNVEENKVVHAAVGQQMPESVPEPVREAIDTTKESKTNSLAEDGADVDDIADDADSKDRSQGGRENLKSLPQFLKDTDASVVLSAASSSLAELHDGGDGGATTSSDEPKKFSFVEELEKFINSSGSSGVRLADSQPVMSDSDEAVDTEDDDGEEDKVLFDSAALTALLKAASSASPENDNASSQNTGGFFSGKGPAGLGSSVPSLRPSAPRSTRSNVFTPSDFSGTRESETETMDEEEKKLNEKINTIRVKFLRLVHRLGHSSEETVAAQVLYRLGLAEGIRRGRTGSRVFSIDAARQTARKLEEEGKDDLDFSCTILVIGKSGVGKSATINSIFGEERTQTNAFQPATTVVKEITGVVGGVKIRVIDTPGLKASVMEQGANRKVLSSVKKYMKKFPPDIILYVDRMDTRSRDSNDLPLLRSIASYLGASIWFNAIVALTHASSAPPDGPNGTPVAYDTSIAHRSHTVQQSIRQAAGDMRLMNPVALVENHPSCRRNRDGNQVLPNGQTWRPQLLLLCYSTKILSEANSLLKLQDPAAGKHLFGGLRYRSAPLPYLLSSLLQSRAHPKVASADQGDDDFELEEELSDADADEEGDEYDQLPPFKPLRKSQLAKLSKEQRKAYLEEYDFRVKLLQKKQLKEELRRRREAKKQFGSGAPSEADEFDPESGGPAAVPVPLPDMILPPSFDGDNPAYRYRFLEPTGSQLLSRPVLDNHGWDHDCGYDGVSLEENLAVAGRFPAGFSVQVTKDKKEFNIHMDSSVSMKHGDHGSTLAGFDVQTVGKQLAYIFRGESKFKNFNKNKTAAGLSFTLIGETVATGIKLEDQITIGKRGNLAASAGAIRAQSDVAYGANLEARIMEKDYPIGQDATTLGLSLMRWRGDLALGANLQTQFSVGRGTKTAVRLGLNNKYTGQITVRTSSSEQLQIALVGLLPLAVSIYRSIRPGESQFAQ